MATQEPGQFIARNSGVNLTGKEYFWAKVNSSGDFVLAGLGDQALGTIQEGKVVGLHSTIMTSGVAKITAGVAIAAGDAVASDANGKAKVVAVGENVCGIAMEAAAADGVIFAVRLAVAGVL